MGSYGTKRLEELVVRLNLATARGDLEWQQTDDETAFVCIFGGPSIELKSKDQDGAAPFILQILNDKGNVIESIRSDTDNNPFEDYGLSELYERARRSATNVDHIIDSILRGLPSIPPAPPQLESESSGYSDEPPF